MKYFLFLALLYSAPLYGSECFPDSQKIHCRLISCIEQTQWKSKKILDPFVVVKEDDHYKYNTILMPMNNHRSTPSFFALNSKGVSIYTFPKETEIGVKCDKGKPSAILELSGECKSRLPFGLGCFFKKSSKLKVNPYRVSYWDGKRVNFLCSSLLSQETKSALELKKQSMEIVQLIKMTSPILKSRMKQLGRALRAEKKSIDTKRILKAVQNGITVEDTGPCRYILDGNTLNLVIEEINKKPQ